MNRLKMAELIAERVPYLAEMEADKWEHADELRSNFVKDFPPSKIAAMQLNDYVIGWGAENKSFCYRLEREMDVLGRILGSPALKFGVYYGKTKRDPARRYRFAKHWGSNDQEAFKSVKRAIVDLLAAAECKDFLAITKSPLSPMFKGKLLFLYYPDQYAPIYAWDYLDYFVKALNLDGTFDTEDEMQRALMDYGQSFPQLRNVPPVLFMRFIYEVCGHPKQGGVSKVFTPAPPLLRTAVSGTQFISRLPAAPARVVAEPKETGKTDFVAQQKRFQWIGDRGEAIVFALEKQRLTQAGRPDLAKTVDHVSQRKDGLGFDILSFDDDGTERPIEVKATTAPDLQGGFYLTANELAKAGDLKNFHLYLVFSAMSESPRVFRMKQPNLKDLGFELEPLAYHVTHPGEIL